MNSYNNQQERQFVFNNLVPVQIRERYPDIESCLSELESIESTEDSAMVLLWRFFTQPNEIFLNETNLDRLNKLERKYRYPEYQPGEEHLPSPFIYAHIACTLVLVLKKRENNYPSERAQEVMKEVERTLKRFWAANKSLELEDYQEQSGSGVICFFNQELFRVKKDEGSYFQALEYFKDACGFEVELLFDLSSSKSDEIDIAREDTSSENEETELANGILSPFRRTMFEKGILKRRIREAIINLEAQEAVDTFENLIIARPPDVKWREVKELCEVLIGNPPEEDGKDVIWKGEQFEWFIFWEKAAVICESMLSPSEYRQMRDADEKKASEERLTSYFFEDYWDILPQGIKDCLVTADQQWNSKEKGNFGIIFDQIRWATEGIIRLTIGHPLTNWAKDKSIKDFTLLKVIEGSCDREPSLSDYIEVSNSPYFEQFLNSLSWLRQDEEGKDDIKFLLGYFKNRAKFLLPKRRKEEHPNLERFRTSLERKEVAPIFKEYLGIGKEGILVRLSSILQKQPDKSWLCQKR